METSKFNKLPTHIAFILDGNGRWANERGLKRTDGHEQGIKTLKEIAKEVKELGIPFMSVYAFSKDNFKRPEEEVNFLMNKIHSEYKELANRDDNSINIRIVGERSNLPSKLLGIIDELNSRPYIDKNFTLIVAFNYSSKLEILTVAEKLEEGNLEYTLENFEKCLYTYPAPQIDFLVRTSGEMRLSDYMLYQASYAELYFPKTYWPDFTKEELYKALDEYQNRDRRFGDAKEKNNE